MVPVYARRPFTGLLISPFLPERGTNSYVEATRILNNQLPKAAVVGIAVAVAAIFFGLAWWRTGTQAAREEPESNSAPQDAVAMDAYERRDRDGHSLSDQLPANRQPGVINHEEK